MLRPSAKSERLRKVVLTIKDHVGGVLSDSSKSSRASDLGLGRRGAMSLRVVLLASAVVFLMLGAWAPVEAPYPQGKSQDFRNAVRVHSGALAPVEAPYAQSRSQAFQYGARVHSELWFYGDADLARVLDLAQGAGVTTIDTDVVWAALD